jgi:hypothetical protein
MNFIDNLIIFNFISFSRTAKFSEKLKVLDLFIVLSNTVKAL